MTQYIVQPSIDLRSCADADLATYQAAGWVLATAGQITNWNANDPYAGNQGVPPAPSLVSVGVAPAAPTQAN